jgi:hypothetical protein
MAVGKIRLPYRLFVVSSCCNVSRCSDKRSVRGTAKRPAPSRSHNRLGARLEELLQSGFQGGDSNPELSSKNELNQRRLIPEPGIHRLA